MSTLTSIWHLFYYLYSILSRKLLFQLRKQTSAPSAFLLLSRVFFHYITTCNFLARALLPRTCDDFHRQKTLVLRIILFSFFFSIILFSLSYRSVQILSGLVRGREGVGERDGSLYAYFSFFFSKKCWERVRFPIA